MPPGRVTARRNPCIGSKPYTRKVHPPKPTQNKSLGESQVANTVPFQPSCPSTHSATPTPPASCLSSIFLAAEAKDWPGFPTRAQYEKIESAYLNRLTSCRREKALISRALFDRIMKVFHCPQDMSEKAIFRYWVRNAFTIAKVRVIPPNPSLGLGYNPGSESARELGIGRDGLETVEREVLLRKGLIVAVKDQIYDLLCFCHGSMNHAGRDRTCAWIRKYYTLVPKDLTARFVKVCPTCIRKKREFTGTKMLTRHAPAVACNSISSIAPTVTRESSHFQVFFDHRQDQSGRAERLSKPYSAHSNDNHLQVAVSNGSLDNSTGIPTSLGQLNASVTLPELSYVDSPSSCIPNLLLSPELQDISFYGVPYSPTNVSEINYTCRYALYPVSERVVPALAYDGVLGRLKTRVPEKDYTWTDTNTSFVDGLSELSPPVLSYPVPLQWPNGKATFGSNISSSNISRKVSTPKQATASDSGAIAKRSASPTDVTSVCPFIPGAGFPSGTAPERNGRCAWNAKTHFGVEDQGQVSRKAEPDSSAFEPMPAIRQEDGCIGATKPPTSPSHTLMEPLFLWVG